MKKKMFSIVAAALLFASCGGGGGGGDNVIGNDVNNDWPVTDLVCEGPVTGGTFLSSDTQANVTVAAGEMSLCANSAGPTLEGTTTLPDNFDPTDPAESPGSVNATGGGFTAYSFNINGDMGFETTADGAVTITLPYNAAADETSLKVFIRIFDPSDNSINDIHGTLDTVNKRITVETRGLPQQFTASVIYNPNMDETYDRDPLAMVVGGGTKRVTPFTWPASRWCVLYNWQQPKLQAACGQATKAGVRTCVNTNIAANALAAQNVYEGQAGFRAPNMYVGNATLPAVSACSALGTTPRYYINLKDEVDSNHFLPEDLNEAISPDGNKYGRIYLRSVSIANPVPHTIGSVVSHEMLHAITEGYEIFWAETTKGYWEGPATTYGITLAVNNFANSSNIKVRSLSTCETELLSDFLMIGTKTRTDASGATTSSTCPAYANQDFFAYVGKQYNADSLAYIAGLYEQMKDAIDTEVGLQTTAGAAASMKKQPPRYILLGAMDGYFLTTFGFTLDEVYKDFLKQRSLSHNTNSQLRTTEPTSGFFAALFETSSSAALNTVEEVHINSESCSVSPNSGSFGNVGPYAARAIRLIIDAAATAATGPTVTITTTPASGSFSDSWVGYDVRGTIGVTEFTGVREYASFATNTSDSATIVFANISQNSYKAIDYKVTCEEGGGGGGGSNTFTVDSFGLPGQPALTPAYVQVTPDMGIGFIIGAVASTTDLTRLANQPNLQVQFGTATITGPGTYTIVGSDPTTGPAAVLYSPGIDNVSSGGHVYESTGGTLTLSAWSTATGEHITGTFSVNMQSDETPPTTGTMSGTFDFIVGMGNLL